MLRLRRGSRGKARGSARSRSTGKKRLWRNVWLAVGGLVIIGIGVVTGFLVAAVRGLPSLSDLEPNPALTSFIYDANGEVVTSVAGWENRVPITLSEVPKTMVEAFIATEDIRFWSHHGVDFRGIIRALYRDLVGASISEGASTITQQLARNAFGLGFERQISRKLKEIILAIQLERRYTKEEILEMYLNQIYFGQSAYGVQAASQLYFGKDVSRVTLPEAALICGVAKNANIYSPFTDPERALARRNIVLDQMAKYGKIDASEAAEAKAAPLGIGNLPPENYPAAYFVDYVLEGLLDKYGADAVYRGGLKIYTTIDMSLQASVEQAYKDILDKAFPLTDKDGNPIAHPESAAVFLDPETGAIRAMIGGRNHQKRLELNRAVGPRGNWEGALRQPGSAFKPIAVYAPAFEVGWSPANVIDDSIKTWNLPGQPPYSPENYNGLNRGLVTLRKAVEQSINTVAIKLLDRIGVETGLRYARKLGITSLVTEGSNVDASLAVAIGGLTQGVSVMDMARAYSAFANGGIRVEPYAVIRVEDKYGNVMEENEPQRQVVLTEQTAYLITDVLKGVVQRGTGVGANIGRPACGKTGTTDDDVDAWYVGYTPEIVGAYWMGYDQPKRMGEVYGSTYCAPMWKQAVGTWLKDKPVRDWTKPEGIISSLVCTASGLQPGPDCPASHIQNELFVQGRQPMAVCNVHAGAIVCADRPWLLATPSCPATEYRVFLNRPEPYEVYNKTPEKWGRVMTYIPEDAYLDYPTRFCDVHGESTIPPFDGLTHSVSMGAYKFAFSPNTITVALGTQLTVRVHAQDTNHGFAVPAYGIDRICLKGQETVITFVCDKPGTFTFYSSVFSGSQCRNMTGQLIVTE